ncbi:DUF1317 family protein [Atlantibacter hermannii]|uniref:DUF1317 family protein n=1 Tax=Atlantibacter hermannii TaxID=565 RepID=UPI002898B014|nr:DUF1317 family protein [Atlantibacter hermannii]
MKTPYDNIVVGTAKLTYSVQHRGWMTPGGTVIRNPLKAQRCAEAMNDAFKGVRFKVVAL